MPSRNLKSAGAAFALAAALSMPAELRAGPWLIGKNNTQLKLTFFSHSTDEQFILSPRLVGSEKFESGAKLPYPFNGESASRAYLLEVHYGLLPVLDFRGYISYYDLQYNDDGGDRRNTGFGDLYAETIVQIAEAPLAFAIRTGFKAPTGEFDIDPRRVPLSENQWDVEGALSAGRSFHPVAAYAKAELGYRYRFQNRETRIKPGNELFFLLEAGITSLRRLALKIDFEGLFATQRESREFDFVVKNADGRMLISLTPYVTAYPVQGVFIEAGVRFLLAGRDYPAGIQYLLSVGWYPATDIQL